MGKFKPIESGPIEEPIEPPRGKRHIMWAAVNEKGNPVVIRLSPDGMEDADYLRRLHELADQHGADSWCYFIGADEGPIKIGMAADVERRLKALQMACPIPLKLFAKVRGGELREAAYHYTFYRHRLHGEWFERVPAILAEMERLNRT